MTEVHLSNDTYDASQSTVAAHLKAMDESKWMKFGRSPISVVCVPVTTVINFQYEISVASMNTSMYLLLSNC